MKVLVFGGYGLIGRELTEVLCDLGAEVLAPSRSNCDISKAGVASAAVASIAPDAVVNLAAQTDVDRCEIHSSDAWDVNSYGAMSVAMACAKVKRKPYLIHLSTDYVFDGGASTPYLPDHRPNPLSLYGRTKASGENAVLEMAGVGGGSVAVRTTGIAISAMSK